MFKKIDHIQIVPSLAERTIEFYTDVLGFSVRRRIDVDDPPVNAVTYLGLGDATVEIVSVDNPQAAYQASWMIGYRQIALKVDDMEQALAYLREKGIVPENEPVDQGDWIAAHIADPDGLRIELKQQKS